MSSRELEKLEYNRDKLELQIQGLNTEISLKELDYKKLIKNIQSIKNKNVGVMN